MNPKKHSILSLLFLLNTIIVNFSFAQENPPAYKLSPELQTIKDNAAGMVKKLFDDLGSPANRDFHSKGFCVKAKLKITPAADLPADADVKFFSTEKSYAVYARHSNGIPGRESNDHFPSVWGLGIKVLGVEGKKFDLKSLGSSKPENSNQDWNMATGATFPFPDAQSYLDNRTMSRLEFASKPKYFEINKAVIKSLIHIDSFLKISYHTQAAYHFGEKYLAKFSMKPCDTDEDKTISLLEALKRSKNYSIENLATEIKVSNACFKLRAQIRPADHRLPPEHSNWANQYPAANPTKLWPEDVIPAIELGEMTYPAQANVETWQKRPKQDEEWKPNCEDLSFNPGNTLQDLRPIDKEKDTLNASRYMAAYQGSVEQRTKLNSGKKPAKQWEPEPIKEEDIDTWLAE